MKKFVLMIVVVLVIYMSFSILLVSASSVLVSGNYTYSVNGMDLTLIKCNPSISGKVYIPSREANYTVTAIADNAFANCTRITSVDIPNSIKSIDSFAFKNCTKLESVNIGSGVSRISIYAFSECTNLQSINVSSANSFFSSEDGVVFDKTRTYLNLYPIGKKDCSYVIPYEVTSISTGAFDKAVNLMTLCIGTNLKDFQDNAFYGCNSLTDIYYTGTEKEWGNINVGNNNDLLNNMNIHYDSVLPTQVKININSLSLCIGEKMVLRADITPDIATEKTVIWSSSDSTIACVSEEGCDTGVSQGTAYIIATSKAGNTRAVSTVTVDSKLAMPYSNIPHGIVVEDTKIKLLSQSDGVEIYYTTNGDEPTNKSNKYTSEITLDKDTIIKAIATKEGFEDSDIAIFEYTVVENSSLLINVSDAQCELGETLDIMVSLENNPGTAVIGFDLEYKNGTFSLYDVENGDIFSDKEMSLHKGTGIIRFTFLNCSENNTKKGTLCTLRFHSNSMWPNDKYEFNIHNIECYDFNENNVDFYGINGSVIVVDPFENP